MKKLLASFLALSVLISLFVAPASADGAVKCDTTGSISIHQDEEYTFGITVSSGNAAPTFTVGNSSVLQSIYAGKSGDHYYFKVIAIGISGSATGVYTALPGQKPVQQCTVTITAPESNTNGNTVGNIVNWGMVTNQSGWLYYSNRVDYKPYKIRTNGTGKMKLCNDSAEYINVIGDWVYYSNGAEKGKLYRIHTNGTARTKLNDDDSDFVSIVDGWIYYQNMSDNCSLYKIRMDGSDRTKLNDSESYNMNVVGDWIYYNQGDLGNLYKIRTDGTECTELSKNFSACLCVSDNWIYYFDEGSINGSTSGLYKIRIDGTGQTRLGNDFSKSINVADGWIYYSSYIDGNNLYKIRTDGTGRTKLNSHISYNVNLSDGWIYYTDASFGYLLYRIRTDGSGLQLFD